MDLVASPGHGCLPSSGIPSEAPSSQNDRRRRDRNRWTSLYEDRSGSCPRLLVQPKNYGRSHAVENSRHRFLPSALCWSELPTVCSQVATQLVVKRFVLELRSARICTKGDGLTRPHLSFFEASLQGCHFLEARPPSVLKTVKQDDKFSLLARALILHYPCKPADHPSLKSDHSFLHVRMFKQPQIPDPFCQE